MTATVSVSAAAMEPAADAGIEIQIADPGQAHPAPALLLQWVLLALGGRQGIAMTLRVVGESEARALNHRYRDRDYPTNVLSFRAPDDWPDVDGEPEHLGDLVVCAPVIAREAVEQDKLAKSHWAHIVIHGVLHLLGHDHESDSEALAMESLERELLAQLGIPDPYRDDHDDAPRPR